MFINKLEKVEFSTIRLNQNLSIAELYFSQLPLIIFCTIDNINYIIYYIKNVSLFGFEFMIYYVNIIGVKYDKFHFSFKKKL